MSDLLEQVRQWPLPGSSAVPFVKEASAGPPEPPEVSVQHILSEIQSQMPTWATEMPAGIEKVAAKRFGTDDDLPEVTSKNIWRHPNAHPLALALLLLDKYGKEYLEWDAPVLRETLRRDKYLVSNSVWTKIQAIRTLFNAPSPWRQWEAFHWVALGLSGEPPSFVHMERPELGHLAAAVDIMKIVDRGREFGEDVDKFVAVVLKDVGVPYAPPPLDFAQRELDDPQIECPDCGTIDRDDNDVKCIGCGSVNVRRVPGELDVLRDAIKREFQQRTGIPLEQAEAGLKEDSVGVPTLRLLAHWDYRNQIRTQLVQQLRSIASG
jgi:hypothetical protein